MLLVGMELICKLWVYIFVVHRGVFFFVGCSRKSEKTIVMLFSIFPDLFSSSNSLTSFRVHGNLGSLFDLCHGDRIIFLLGADNGGAITHHGPYNRPNGYTGYAEQVFGQSDPT